MNASDDKKIQIQQMVLKSQRSLKAARQHLQDKDFDFTASRAYYAVFYLMETVLLVKDLSGSTHSGIIRLFSEHFIKTNVFPKDFGKLISRLFRERQSGDYSFGEEISEEVAQEDVRLAEDFSQAIVDYLKQKELLSS